MFYHRSLSSFVFNLFSTLSICRRDGMLAQQASFNLLNHMHSFHTKQTQAYTVSCCCCSHVSIVAYGHMESLKFFWHQPNGLRFTHRRTICRPAYFVETTQLLPHPGHWVLTGLHVKSFNVMTPDNDCTSIPLVSMLEAGLRDRIRKRVRLNPNSLCRSQRRYTYTLTELLYTVSLGQPRFKPRCS